MAPKKLSEAGRCRKGSINRKGRCIKKKNIPRQRAFANRVSWSEGKKFKKVGSRVYCQEWRYTPGGGRVNGHWKTCARKGRWTDYIPKKGKGKSVKSAEDGILFLCGLVFLLTRLVLRERFGYTRKIFGGGRVSPVREVSTISPTSTDIEYSLGEDSMFSPYKGRPGFG